jgi:hypothetical protein
VKLHVAILVLAFSEHKCIGMDCVHYMYIYDILKVLGQILGLRFPDQSAEKCSYRYMSANT